MDSKFTTLDMDDEQPGWLSKFLKNSLFLPKSIELTCVHYDRQAAIVRIGSVMYNNKSCHIWKRNKFIRCYNPQNELG